MSLQPPRSVEQYVAAIAREFRDAPRRVRHEHLRTAGEHLLEAADRLDSLPDAPSWARDYRDAVGVPRRRLRARWRCLPRPVRVALPIVVAGLLGLAVYLRWTSSYQPLVAGSGMLTATPGVAVVAGTPLISYHEGARFWQIVEVRNGGGVGVRLEGVIATEVVTPLTVVDVRPLLSRSSADGSPVIAPDLSTRPFPITIGSHRSELLRIDYALLGCGDDWVRPPSPPSTVAGPLGVVFRGTVLGRGVRLGWRGPTVGVAFPAAVCGGA